jgi:tRNA A37 threonylcarbamoyladenosine dehydratase
VSPLPQRLVWGEKAFDRPQDICIKGANEADADAVALLRDNFTESKKGIAVIIGERGDKAIKPYTSQIPDKVEGYYINIGKNKVDIIKDRILDINPECEVHANKVFYLPENADDYPLDEYDYIADAVDTVAAKVELAVRADKLGIPMIAAMGAGNKLDPTRFEVADISKTSVCPLAKVMRYELKKRGISKVKVVYSKEEAIKHGLTENGKPLPGSVSFVPSVAGLIIAGEVIKDLIRI